MPADEDFLSRWSRRKAEARQALEPDAKAPAVPEPQTEPEVGEPPELPDPEKLELGSDFRAFMARNVPPDLRRLALRRLWRVNPIINSLDGLDDYYVTQDFTDAATVVPDLRTIYRVGKEALETVARLEEPTADTRTDPPPKTAIAQAAAIEEGAQPLPTVQSSSKFGNESDRERATSARVNNVDRPRPE
jgi:Protein of unknown function (DUF3306)